MNNKGFYKSTFSQLHTNTDFNLEDFKKIKYKEKQRIKIIATAASVCIILVASTTAYAMNMFGLKDMLLSTTFESFTNNTAKPSVSPEAFISLQGFADSNEYKALNEWTSFCDNYDKDGALLDKVGNGSTGLDPKYDLYSVYTQEMADKLDEVIKKYNLNLHSSLDTSITTKELIQKVAWGNFLGANINRSAYLYEDGSFALDGYAVVDRGLRIDYQFSNYKKGTFTDVSLNIGNISDYKEWSYTTTCGINVCLAISPKKSLIIADLGDSFMTLNVLAGTAYGYEDENGKITSSNLEELADSFDFSLIKSQVASPKGNNKVGKIKNTTREGIIGEFQTLLTKQPEISEVYTFIKDKAKDAKKEEVTEMLSTMEAMMDNIRGGVMYEEVQVPQIQDALEKADKAKIDFNQADKLQDGKLKDLVEKAKSNGLIIQNCSTGYYPVIDYTRYIELSVNATEDMKAYVDMQAVESANPYEKGSSLAIGWDEMVKRAILTEEFLKKYEFSRKAFDVKMLYYGYKMNILGGSTIPVFDEKTKVMNAHAKKAYEMSIRNYPNSELAKILKDFLDVVSHNGNKWNEEVEEFVQSEIYGD